MRERGLLTSEQLDELWELAREETEDAVDFAEAAPFEPVDTLTRHTYAEEESR